jgi:molecular chaperone DnaK
MLEEDASHPPDDRDALKGKLIIGIDLGTTKSAVSAWNEEAGRVEVLVGESGRELTPSVVAYGRDGRGWLVGDEAKALLQEYPSDVVYSIKRYIGRWFKDRNVQRGLADLTYRLVPGGGTDQLNDVLVDFGGSPPPEPAPAISGRVLTKLRRDAAHALRLPVEEVEYAVITVPAYFDVLQRHATIEASRRAGLKVVAILNEPTAAALAYREQLEVGREQNILVYDLGGGTFDVSLLRASRGEGGSGYAFYTVAVDGDTRLGGDDIDAGVLRWLVGEIESRYGRKVAADDNSARSRLRLAAERAKVELSTETVATVSLPGLTLKGQEPFDASLELTRGQLESCAKEVLAKASKITRRVVEEVAGMTWDEIDQVILVGGQTLMPAVKRSVEEVAGRPPHIIDRPQMAVALGAGEYAHILSLGQGKFHENTLTNVLALPLGVQLEENTFHPLVEANRRLPYRSDPFPVRPTEKDQTSIRVDILQKPREATLASECVLLGSITMPVVVPSLVGWPKFEIVFDVQSDGTMRVEVTNRETGQSQTRDIFETETGMRDKPLGE